MPSDVQKAIFQHEVAMAQRFGINPSNALVDQVVPLTW